VSKLRISVVQYLNTAPLVRGFTHGPLQGKYDLSFTVPSLCAEALRTGAADSGVRRRRRSDWALGRTRQRLRLA